jgi:hypothetical protein
MFCYSNLNARKGSHPTSASRHHHQHPRADSPLRHLQMCANLVVQFIVPLTHLKPPTSASCIKREIAALICSHRLFSAASCLFPAAVKL